ncbi:MAG: A24 family peptidase [Firmicutes bacterium]|jgi:Flp pilus assembly protein protease CpaA|uniref:Prepilin type IV endopeptidase peptidase domain-containing protein n=1 Tax=Sulfobacillus benefaciens TaxID=453960 RepID=A0A2T2XBU6_9FIRM|nr:A24 family peptidase [Bacillota bacterium]MCL5014762.1 A24 family peptidase [Bacillota bacterium]PSR31916.1 MAG: hypothetical protein C7B43_01460 [Sulfobacillus benefaciens]HBQ94624.1 hypothetical protein [Sulfobacillus sp.]
MNNVVLNLWVGLAVGAIMAGFAAYWGLTEHVSWILRGIIAVVVVVLAVTCAWYDGRWDWTGDIYLGIWTVVAYVDWKEQIIPNRWVVATLLWGIISTPWTDALIIHNGLTALGLFLFYVLVYVVSRGGLGLGDVKFAGAQGLVLGWPQGLLASLIGLWAAGIYSLLLLLVFRRPRSQAIALGPFLVLGGFAGLLGVWH